MILVLELFLGELMLFAATRPAANRARTALEDLADRLPGRVERPWFRAPRVLGHHEGRDVTVVWRGEDRFELRCWAPPGLEVDVRRPAWWARLLGRSEPRVRGGSAAVQERARGLFRWAGGERIFVRDGQLVLRARVRPDGDRLHGMVRELVELAWAAPQVRVVPVNAPLHAPPPRVNASPTGGRGPELRCPFCHDQLAADAPVVHCAACDAPHHPSCFEEGEGCSISGCRERKARGHRVRA